MNEPDDASEPGGPEDDANDPRGAGDDTAAASSDPAGGAPDAAAAGAGEAAAAPSDRTGGDGSGTGEESSIGDTAGDADASDQDLDAHGRAVAQWRERSRRRNERGGSGRGAAAPDDTRPGKRAPRKQRPWWIELPIIVVIAFLATFLIQTFIARVYYVPSGSMEQTLHGVTHGGDRILAYKLGYDFGTPHQGDVVVFQGPSTWVPEAAFGGPTTWLGKIGEAVGSVVGIAPANEKDFVKRVIAVAGQKVSCCDVKGRVQVDGVSLNEPYLFMDVGNYSQWAWTDGESSCDVDPSDPTRFQNIRCFGPYTVPKGDVWVMGDHRSDSADSTYNCRGLVPASNVHCQGPIPVKDVIGKAVAIVMPPTRWGIVHSPDIMPQAAAKADG